MKSSGEVKLFVGILVVALLLVGGVLFITQQSGSGPKPPPPPEPAKVDKKTLMPSYSRIKGDANAAFTLVEFGDYQCPQCRAAKDEVGKILKARGGKLNYVFHFFQASPTHLHAQKLALAAEAAAEQGKFWEMHEKLFDSQMNFDKVSDNEALDQVFKIASELKLDMLKFRPAMTGDNATRLVLEQTELAKKLDVNSTPHFFFFSPSGKATRISNLKDLVAHLKEEKHWK